MAGPLALDGHPADGVEEDDLVARSGFGLLLRLRGRSGDRRRSGGSDEGGPTTADLNELGEDREGDLLGRLGPDVEPGRRPQRSDPLLGDLDLPEIGTDRYRPSR